MGALEISEKDFFDRRPEWHPKIEVIVHCARIRITLKELSSFLFNKRVLKGI